jgi:MFS family permease
MATALFTRRFVTMCGFSFTVMLSAFQLLPTVPFRILELGGGTFAAGLFLALLTYASALSAPLTGALGDRVGRGPLMAVCSGVIAVLAVAYALAPAPGALLVLALVHGIVWSGLLSGSAAYTIDLIPAGRRAEGIGYFGLAGVLAVAAAPTVGLWIYSRGWPWLCGSIAVLNLVLAAIALSLREPPRAPAQGRAFFTADLLEWRVALVAVTLFLYSFGYGGITSFVALYADSQGITPRALYFAVYSGAIVLTRPFAGRLADRVGHRRVLVPCLGVIVLGYGLLAAAETRAGFVLSGLVFGIGFGSAYPVFAAHVIRHVDDRRRGAAFGGMLAAFDTGIGSGSMATGWLVQRYGYGTAYGLAALLACLAIPYFLAVEPRVFRRAAP